MAARVATGPLLRAHGETVSYATDRSQRRELSPAAWEETTAIVRVDTMTDDPPYVHARCTLDVAANDALSGVPIGWVVMARGRRWTVQSVTEGADDGWRRVMLA